jgi:hypothetical protein
LQPHYTWNYLVWRNVVFLNLPRSKNKLSATQKILSEEIARYDDKNELKEEQRNALFYLVVISVIALSRTIFFRS